MLLRLLTFLLAAFALTGCILQSQAPLFAEKDGVAALASLGKTFVPFNLVDGEWQAEKDTATFKAVGKHYEVPGDTGKTVTVIFVALSQNSWVMQATEPDKAAIYVITHREGTALHLQVPVCEDLKKNAVLAKRLRFDRDDCFAPADFKLADFRALAKGLAPAEMKLVAAE